MKLLLILLLLPIMAFAEGPAKASIDLVGLASVIAAVGILFTNLIAAVVSAKVALRTEKAIAANASNIQKIEIATNSTKDALVKITKENALAQGNVEGRAQLLTEQTIREEGRVLGVAETVIKGA